MTQYALDPPNFQAFTFTDNKEMPNPGNYFSTPDDLAARIDSGTRLPTDLVIAIGNACKMSEFTELWDQENTPAVGSEMAAWGSIIVRMTKLPHFTIRSLTFDMRPCKIFTVGIGHLEGLLTRISWAIWRVERNQGYSKANCMLIVKGWAHVGGDKLGANLSKPMVGLVPTSEGLETRGDLRSFSCPHEIQFLEGGMNSLQLGD